MTESSKHLEVDSKLPGRSAYRLLQIEDRAALVGLLVVLAGFASAGVFLATGHQSASVVAAVLVGIGIFPVVNAIFHLFSSFKGEAEVRNGYTTLPGMTHIELPLVHPDTRAVMREAGGQAVSYQEYAKVLGASEAETR